MKCPHCGSMINPANRPFVEPVQIDDSKIRPKVRLPGPKTIILALSCRSCDAILGVITLPT